jgi:hypothetical protein
MKATNSLAVSVAGCVLLASSILLGRQEGELSGIRGIPVEGHDIVAGIEFVGTKQLNLGGTGWPKLRERLQANGADLRLGWPLDGEMLCRFKEVILDVMAEKGFPDATISHKARPTFGNPQHLTIKFTIIEGKRSRPISQSATRVPPAVRCMR